MNFGSSQKVVVTEGQGEICNKNSMVFGKVLCKIYKLSQLFFFAKPNNLNTVNTILEPLECNIAQQEEKARAKIDKLEKESRKPNTKHSRPKR